MRREVNLGEGGSDGLDPDWKEDPEAATPIEQHGRQWVKRDDLFVAGGARGGKVRACLALAKGAAGLVTAGSRSSPQCYIVAKIAAALGIPCRVHCPSGKLGPELLGAQDAGAEVIQHQAGHNNVIVARAREDAKARGWREIPFGMECREAVEQTRHQVRELPEGVKRIVIPVGSGMSLCGVLWGLRDAGISIPVLGVVVGANPMKRMETYAPPGWKEMCKLVPSGTDYHKPAARVKLESGLVLDPHYEAKCLPKLLDGDLLWVVGIREGVQARAAAVPGGGKWPSSKIGADGSFARADLHAGVDQEEGTGTSIFDPVLTEAMIRWFSPKGGFILDPFAGGSVRGIVAAKVGRHYVGVDLRAEQVEANRQQGCEICGGPGDIMPTWHAGDSRQIDRLAVGNYDFIFSCPPYANLERYSDDPADISTLDYPQFLEAYREIIRKSCAMLKPDRFACFVVGEVRGPDGNYLGFVPDTIAAFKAAGLHYYNEIILVTSIGSLPVRCAGPMRASRKIGKTHQNVLVFVKGDGRAATLACGEIEVIIPPESMEESEGGEDA